MAQNAWFQLAQRDGFGFCNAKYADILIRATTSNQAIHFGNQESSSAISVLKDKVQLNRLLEMNAPIKSKQQSLQLNNVLVSGSNIIVETGSATSNFNAPILASDQLYSTEATVINNFTSNLYASNACVEQAQVSNLAVVSFEADAGAISNLDIIGELNANKITIDELNVQRAYVSNTLYTPMCYISDLHSSNLTVPEVADINTLSNVNISSMNIFASNYLEAQDIKSTRHFYACNIDIAATINATDLNTTNLITGSNMSLSGVLQVNVNSNIDLASSNITSCNISTVRSSNSQRSYTNELFAATSINAPTICNLVLNTSIVYADNKIIAPTISNQLAATSNLIVTNKATVLNLDTSNSIHLYATVCNNLVIKDRATAENRIDASNLHVSQLYSSNQVSSNIRVKATLESLLVNASNINVASNITVPYIINNTTTSSNITTQLLYVTGNEYASNINVSDLYSSNQVGGTVTVTSNLTSLATYTSNLTVTSNTTSPYITSLAISTSNLTSTSNISAYTVDITSNLNASNLHVSDLYSSNQTGILTTITSNLVSILVTASNINVASNTSTPFLQSKQATISNITVTSNITTPIAQVTSNLFASNINVTYQYASNVTANTVSVTETLTAVAANASNLYASNADIQSLNASNLTVPFQLTVKTIQASNITACNSITTPAFYGTDATFSNLVTSSNFKALVKMTALGITASSLEVSSNITSCNVAACNLTVVNTLHTSNMVSLNATISNTMTALTVAASNISVASNITVPTITVSNLTASQVDATFLNVFKANASNWLVYETSTSKDVVASNLTASNITATTKAIAKQLDASNITVTSNITTPQLLGTTIYGSNIYSSNARFIGMTASSITTPLITADVIQSPSNIQASNASICNLSTRINNSYQVFYYSGSNDYLYVKTALDAYGVTASNVYAEEYTGSNATICNINSLMVTTCNINARRGTISNLSACNLNAYHVSYYSGSNDYLYVKTSLESYGVLASNIDSIEYTGCNILSSNVTVCNVLTAKIVNSSNTTVSNLLTAKTINACNLTLCNLLNASIINSSNISVSNILAANQVNASNGIIASNIAASNIAIGKSTAAFPLDVQGDINFTGALYQNSQKYISSQWTTASTSNTISITQCNVGIGTKTPQYPLDVVGDLNFTGALYQNGSRYIGSQWTTTPSSNAIYIASCNVGIGKSNPTKLLDVNGDINFEGELYQKGSKYIGSQWTTSAASNQISIIGCNVGIGYSNPLNSLEVNGSILASSNLLFVGTKATPYVTWADDLQTGIYHDSHGQVGIMTNGTSNITMSNSIVNVNGQLLVNSKQVRTLSADDTDAPTVPFIPTISVLRNTLTTRPLSLTTILPNIFVMAQAIDKSGNTYIVGDCTGALPPLYNTTGNATHLPLASTPTNTYGVLIKYDFAGNPVSVATLTNSSITCIAVTDADQIYIGATCTAPPSYTSPSNTTTVLSTHAGANMYLISLSGSTGTYQWSACGVGTPNAISCDATGAIWMVGSYTEISDFGNMIKDSAGSTYTIFPATTGIPEAFFLKFSTTGFGVAHYTLSSPASSFNDIEFDSSNNAYIYGSVYSESSTLMNSITLAGATNDAALVKVNASGQITNAFRFRTSLSANQYFDVHDVTVDLSGNIYATGIYNSDTGSPLAVQNINNNTASAITLPNTTNFISNQFVIKYGPSGAVLWASYIKPINGAYTRCSIAGNKSGQVYALGYLDNSGIAGVYNAAGVASLTNPPSTTSAYIVKYETTGDPAALVPIEGATSITRDVSGSVSIIRDILVKPLYKELQLITRYNTSVTVHDQTYTESLNSTVASSSFSTKTAIVRLQEGGTPKRYRLLPTLANNNGLEKVIYSWDTTNGSDVALDIFNSDGTSNLETLAYKQTRSYIWYNGNWITASDYKSQITADNLVIRGDAYLGGGITVAKPITISGIMVQKRTNSNYYNITQTLTVDGLIKDSNGLLILDMQSNTNADSIRFQKKNIELARLTATGNLGIGTTNPLYPLDVVGNVNFTGQLYQNGQKYIGSQFTTTNSSNAIYIISSNVGIGKTNPQYPLDVLGNINFTGLLYQNGSKYIGSQFTTTASSNAIYILNSNIGIGTTTPGKLLDVNGDINFNGQLFQNNQKYIGSQFTTNSNTSNQVYIIGSNIGIGTSNPTTPLHVEGDTTLNGNINVLRAFSINGLFISKKTGSSIANTTATSLDGYTKANGNLVVTADPGCNVRIQSGTNQHVTFSNGQICANSNDTVTVPAYTWLGDNTTGLFHQSSGVIGVSASGNAAAYLSSSNINLMTQLSTNSNLRMTAGGTLCNINSIVLSSGQVIASADTASTPSYTWLNDVNTGLYRISAAQVGIACAGTPVLAVTSAGAILDGTLTACNITSSNISVTTITASSLNVTGSITQNGQPLSSGGGGSSVSNLVKNISSIPSNGFSSNVVNVPFITITPVSTSPLITYGRAALGTNNGVSLYAGGTLTVNVTHNLGYSNYIVYSTPDDVSNVLVKNQSIGINMFQMVIKNINSTSNLGEVGINYQLVQTATSNNIYTVAQAVTVVTPSLTLTSSGASNSTTLYTLSNQATDPQGYIVSYTFASGSNNRVSITGGSNLVYTNAASNDTLNLVLIAQNPYIVDPSKTISISLTEQYVQLSISSVILQQRHYATVSTLLPNKSFTLLYRGSRDGFTPQAFHSRCDNNTPLFIVVLATNNFIATAYTPVAFTSANSWKSSPIGTAWLNNLESSAGIISSTKYTNLTTTNVIQDNPATGPTFGDGYDMIIHLNAANAIGWFQYNVFNAPNLFGPGGSGTLSNMEIYKVT